MNHTKKKLNGKMRLVETGFTGENLTQYAGLKVVAEYLNSEGVTKTLSDAFPTIYRNATKFGTDQILLSLVLASICGVNRLSKIANFTKDGLVRNLLRLEKSINQNALSVGLKKLGEAGARKLSEIQLARNAKLLTESKLERITFDADSTVSLSYGNQEGAAKGYNPTKHGAKSYHPLVLFASELKLLYLGFELVTHTQQTG